MDETGMLITWLPAAEDKDFLNMQLPELLNTASSSFPESSPYKLNTCPVIRALTSDFYTYYIYIKTLAYFFRKLRIRPCNP